ncbi:hypothetical protein ED312_23305 [Sinomicrobium pectinilyticum]|uniref:Uncharacterized protein n=1 Tax=Sinomicrobium pectinilyticum TaxID=1084421 RepID=A0A3N0CY52_SINP1|nr:hypothetical protein ED312_23305 [Sinomicrobium pectinilyticum]
MAVFRASMRKQGDHIEAFFVWSKGLDCEVANIRAVVRNFYPGLKNGKIFFFRAANENILYFYTP